MNPNEIDAPRTRRTESIVGFDEATVITADTHTSSDEVGHEVTVEPDLIDGSEIAEVLFAQTGDITIPEEGDRVLIGYRIDAKPVVLGSRYPRDATIPEYEPGERRIGHPASDSYIMFHADGSVTIEDDSGTTVTLDANGDVTVNGGSTQPVTDVSTSTDGDGHVTSISLTRADGVFVPSQ